MASVNPHDIKMAGQLADMLKLCNWLNVTVTVERTGASFKVVRDADGVRAEFPDALREERAK